MATVTWSDHALQCMREQTRCIVEQSCSFEIAWKLANDIFGEAEQLADFPKVREEADGGDQAVRASARRPIMPGEILHARPIAQEKTVGMAE